MRHPTHVEYAEAVGSYPDFSILDSTIKGGTAARGNDNHLVVYSGGFSIVFRFTNGPNSFALRCWIKNIKDAEIRYQEVSTYLKQRNLTYFVDFEYIPEGILVNGTRWPITRMEWAEGETLCQFIQSNLHDAGVLRNTASQFLKMVETLHAHQISHGDLQDGNILLKQNGTDVEIKLIDYDSLFVPALRGYPDSICGVAEYQHPKRMAGGGTANETVDYFSELVIYLSLIALAEKSDLWSRFGQREERGLLFVAEDFKNPSQSQVFQELEKLSPDVMLLTSKLKEFCTQSSIDELAPLESLLPRLPVSCSWPLISGLLALVLVIFSILFMVRMNAKDDLLRELENQLTRQVNANQEVESDNKDLRSQHSRGEEHSKSAEIQIEKLHGEITQLNNKYRDLQAQLEVRTKDDQTLQVENARLVRQNRDLQNRLTKRQTDSAQSKGDTPRIEKPAPYWNGVFSGEVAKTLIGHKSWVSSVAFSSDGYTLASGSGDKTLLLWDVTTGTVKRPLKGHSNNVICVAFRPGRQMLASGGEDKAVHLWYTATGKITSIVKLHEFGVSSITFSPDGATLASASKGDSDILIWDVATGATKQRLYGFGVTSVAFNPHGTILASGGRHHNISLWDVATGTTKRTLKGHNSRITSVAFNPDGTTLASASADRTIRLWH